MSGPPKPAGGAALPSRSDFYQYTYNQVWEVLESFLEEWDWDDSDRAQLQNCKYDGGTLLSMKVQDFVHDGLVVGLARRLRAWLDGLEGGRKAQKRTGTLKLTFMHTHLAKTLASHRRSLHLPPVTGKSRNSRYADSV